MDIIETAVEICTMLPHKMGGQLSEVDWLADAKCHARMTSLSSISGCHPSRIDGQTPNLTACPLGLTSAHPALFSRSNNRIHPFPPCQNTRIDAIFHAIENLELLPIFSWFIGFIAFFWCFFYDYIIHPHPAPPAAAPNSEQASRTSFGAMFTSVYYIPLPQPSPGPPGKSSSLTYR